MSGRWSFALLALLCVAAPASAARKALFDNAHAETAGNADWVIDNDQPIPSPAQSGITSSTTETYWTGAVSAWGVALVKLGYTVETNTSALTYGNTSNPRDLANYDVLIVDEPNTSFTSAEATAILAFIQNGGGLVAISDHYGSDRNNDGIDSPRIWNALDPNHLLGVHFAVSGESNNNISQTSTNVNALSSDLVTRGPEGNVTGLAYHNGTTMTLYPSVNSTVRGEVWMTGVSQASLTGVMCASTSYGSGRVVFAGDSSPADDGTANSGNTVFNGWNETGASDGTLFLNATLWVTRSSTDTAPPTVSISSPVGGETWKAGSTHAITWSASDNVGVTSVDLAWSTDGGASYPGSIATGLANSGTYSWTVPNTPGATNRVRVTAHDAAGNSAAAASASNFTIDTWTITASAGANGSISPAGSVPVAQGASQSFSITPNSGFSVSSVLVDGASVGAVTSYTFTNVAANHTISASFASGSSSGPAWTMASGNYFENFSDIANWTNNFQGGIGASVYHSVPVEGSGTIPDGFHTTVSTATFVSGTTGGVQKGSGTIELLSTGTTDNTSADAIDLFLDFTGVSAGTLSYDWATVFNSTGDRKGSLRVYASTDGATFTELPAADVLNVANNVTASGHIISVALPAGFSGSSTARIRFYYHNGTGGTTGSRPKISMDNVSVTAGGALLAASFAGARAASPPESGAGHTPALELSRPAPDPSREAALLRFTLPAAGSARLEIFDLRGRRVWATAGEFAAGVQTARWDGRGASGAVAPAGIYFVRLETIWGTRTARLVRMP